MGGYRHASSGVQFNRSYNAVHCLRQFKPSGQQINDPLRQGGIQVSPVLARVVYTGLIVRDLFYIDYTAHYFN